MQLGAGGLQLWACCGMLWSRIVHAAVCDASQGALPAG